MARDRKLYLGPRLRLLRRELGLNQTEMAGELGVSPSYLNHLERNQRPLTAQMLLRLADTYDLDVRGFVAGGSEAAVGDLTEVFADALVRDIGIARQEVLELAENYPNVAEAVGRLYRAVGDLRQLPQRVESGDAATAGVASPLAWVRQWLETRRNHFAELDAAAEALSAELGEEPEALRHTAAVRLAERHDTALRIVPAEVLGGAAWHYDYHRRRLLLSERLDASARSFAVLRQLARVALAQEIAAALEAAGAPEAESRALAAAALANYAAAALLMPYARFHAAVTASRYDIDLLAARFGASWEQVAHRLTTLDRPSARGVELFLLKVDAAGNVAKRYGPAPLPRFGGGCPRWRVHRAFAAPGETVVDRAALPDGTTLLTWARATRRASDAPPTLLVLGCAAEAAGAVRYGDAVRATTAIGPACHLCERTDCPDRSLPPITRGLELDPNRRGANPYPFRAV